MTMPPRFVWLHRDTSQLRRITHLSAFVHLLTYHSRISVLLGGSTLANSRYATFMTSTIFIGFDLFPSNSVLHQAFHLCQQVNTHRLCSFNRWYTDFTVIRPSLVCVHIIRSLLGVVLSGMLRMKVASILLKLPRIASSSHSRFCPINSWILISDVCPSFTRPLHSIS